MQAGLIDIGKMKNEMDRMSGSALPFLFIINFKATKGILIPLEKCAALGIFFNVEGNSNTAPQHVNSPVKLRKVPVRFSEYHRSFNMVRKEIELGNSYLVNLTFPTRISANLKLTELFHKSSAPYKLLYQEQFLVFSPECFVKISGDIIRTFPMKGTIDANVKNAAEILLKNKKEEAEHATIVDLLRNDLSLVADEVRVEKFRYIERIETHSKPLLQVSSLISGKIKPEFKNKAGSVMVNLLPAGSISGAPKKSTLEIIEKAETYERGFYTGIFGIFDGNSLNSAVMIRFIENRDGKLVYKSGGGITSQSDPRSEYKELIDKIYVPVN